MTSEEAKEREELAEGAAAEGEAAGEPVASSNADDLERKLQEAEERAEENRTQMLRALADGENLKKRLVREKEEATRFANERLLRDLLPVLDNLELALAHADRERDGGSLVEGVEMVVRLFRDALERHGVVTVEAEPGTPFDPTVHEAVATEAEGAVAPNAVIRCELPGYRLHDRLLRAACVVVAAPLPSDAG